MSAHKGAKYVIGIDPAAERDNFAIVVLEIWPNHARVVYCWAVNRPEFIKRKKKGLVTDDDYYAYCASKIRTIVQYFRPLQIEMDSQGGGTAMAELLRNKKLLDKKEDFPIYEIIDRENPTAHDLESDGPHILNLISQTNDWNQLSNVVLHKSMEMKHLLFPAFDTVKMQAALAAEKAQKVTFDTFEENVDNIEKLKNELCTIQMSATSTGKEKFDTPKVVLPGAVEGRKKTGYLRKDRYSALLFAHRYYYDQEIKVEIPINYEDVAGNIKKVATKKDEGMYQGPGMLSMKNADWANKANTGAVKRGKAL
jgi:hypothetical protein